MRELRMLFIVIVLALILDRLISIGYLGIVVGRALYIFLGVVAYVLIFPRKKI